MNGLVLPSIFTAVDKFSGPLKTMQGSAVQFADRASAGIARAERSFRKFTPAISETQKQLFSMVSAAAIAGAVIGGVAFSTDSIIQYEKAVASFRTIVGGSDKEFKPFQQQINAVAKDTKKSSVDVALAFEKIASLNATFAETPEAIGAVSKAAITLSKASGDELGPSAESLVGIMNQFNLAANQSDRTINVLAAGAGVGAASIVQTSEAFVNFGSVAKGANITLEQSVGLIQTLGKFSVFGAEAGTKLRGSVLKLQQAGIGYKSGQFQINDALDEARKKIDKLKTAKEKDAAVLKMFGAENIATGKILLNNIEQFKQYTAGVTGTNSAAEQAAVRSNTLANKLDELKNSWVNMLTGSDQASAGLDLAKTAIGFVTDHMSQIISVGAGVIGFFIAWKAWIIASKIALMAFRAISSLFFLVDMIKYIASTQGLTFAQAAWSVVVSSATVEMAALNAVMSANPIGVVILAVAALAAGIMFLINRYEQLKQEYMDGLQKRQTSAILEEQKSVQNLAARYEKLGMSKKEAMSKAISEERKILDEKAADIEKRIAKGRGTVGFMGIQQGGLDPEQMLALKQQATAVSMQRLEVTKAQAAIAKGEQPFMASAIGADGMPLAPSEGSKDLVNPEGAKQDALIQKMENTNNANVTMTIKGDTDKVDVSGDAKFAKVSTGSTIIMKK